ncbi:MAG: hypothetical protein J6X93_00730 [Bacilli bacterium]|nr:hypothetical protein [Bacilli bacterium]
MVKLILSLMVGISLLSPKYSKYFIEIDEVVYERTGDLVYLYDDSYKVKYKDILIYEAAYYTDLTIGILNNNIYILFKGDNYTLSKYSLSGNLISSINLFNCYSYLDLLTTADYLYLYGGIDLDLLNSEAIKEENSLTNFDLDLLTKCADLDHYLLDGFTMKLNLDLEIEEINIYKGNKEEKISKIYNIDNKLYLTGSKDYLSEGIYGNGGLTEAYFLILLEDSEIILREIYQEKIINLVKVNNNLVVCTKDEIYCYDSDYSLVLSLNLPSESIFSYVTFNYSLLVISEDKGYLIDLDDGKLLDSFDIDGYDYVCASDFLYFKKEGKPYVLDFLEEGLFFDEVNYCYYRQIEEMNGLYGKYMLVDTMYEPYFDRLVYGAYDVTYFYKYSDLVIEKCGKCVVEREANVMEGGIYPANYHLFFSGTGYLDGKMIYQNHELVEAKEYELVLEGTNETRTIHFRVDSNQISFTNNINTSYDLYVLENEYIKVEISSSDKLESVYVNDKLYDVISENDKYYINLLVYRGDNGYIIRYALDEAGNKIPINYFVKVLGIIDGIIDIDTNAYINNEDVEVDLIINSGNELIRVIVLKVLKDGIENIYYYPVGNINIDLPNLDSANFNLYLGLYNGSTSYDLIKVFEGMVDDSLYLEVEIKSKQEFIEELAFKINKNKGISYIEVGDNYINLAKTKNYKLIIIFSCISILISIIILTTRYKKKIKKNK